MGDYKEARGKLTNTQLDKWKFAAKNKTRTILRTYMKNFQDEKLPYELFLSIRQTIKIMHFFANNM